MKLTATLVLCMILSCGRIYAQDAKPANPPLPLVTAEPIKNVVPKPDVITADEVDQLKFQVQSLLIERDSLRSQNGDLQKQLSDLSLQNDQSNTQGVLMSFFAKYGVSPTDYELKVDPQDKKLKLVKKPAPVPVPAKP